MVLYENYSRKLLSTPQLDVATTKIFHFSQQYLETLNRRTNIFVHNFFLTLPLKSRILYNFHKKQKYPTKKNLSTVLGNIFEDFFTFLNLLHHKWGRNRLWSPETKYGTKYSGMDQVKFVGDSFENCWRSMVYFKQIILLQFFYKGCLPHILLGPFLNTLSHL